MEPSSLIVQFAVGAGISLTVKILALLLKQAHKLSIRLIEETQRRQEMQRSELLNCYVDLEELLGDFLEKYRDLTRQNPPPARWDFCRIFMSDVLGLSKDLCEMTIRRLFSRDETPRA